MARHRIEEIPPEGEVFITPEPEDPDAGDLEHLEEAGPEWRWTVYRRLAPYERPVYGGEERVILTRLSGAIDLMEFQREWGGGTFEFWGTIKGKRGLRKKHVFALVGQIRPLNPPTESPAAHNGSAEIGQLQRQLDKLELRLSNPPAVAPPPPPIDPAAQMAATIGLVKAVLELAPRPTPVAPVAGPTPIKEVMEAVNLGISLQQNAGGGTESDGIAIAKMVMPAITRLGEAVLSRRATPPPTRTTRPAEAEVIEPEPVRAPGVAAAAPASNPTEDPNAEASARWTTLLGSLARAIGERREPGDFAGSVEDIMLADEIELFKSATPEQVTAELRATAGNRYPVLATPQAQEYIAAVLAELRQPSYEDPA